MGVRVSEAVFPPMGSVNVAVDIKGTSKVMSRAIPMQALPFGTVPERTPFVVDSNDPQSQIAGLQKRLARDLPTPQPGQLVKLGRFVDRWLSEHLVPLDALPTYEEFMETRTYNTARKIYLNQVHLDLNGACPTKRQCWRIKSFIKREAYQVPKYPRWINSRSDVFKVYSGPAFYAIEQALFKDEHFMKKIPTEDRPSRVTGLKKDCARYFATDFTSFEASFTRPVMEVLELKLYSYMLAKWPQLSSCICNTISGINKGSTSSGVSFTCEGQRMSGDMCTSLGNGFSNFMITSFLLAENGHVLWDGVFEGDDGLVAMYDAGPKPSPEQYAELGFSIKTEDVADPELSSFCGLMYVDGQVLCDPVKFTGTFGWSASCIGASKRVLLGLLRAKALSAIHEKPSCPVVGVIARRAEFLTRGYAARFVYDGFHLPVTFTKTIPEFCPSQKLREAFHSLYGISPSTQIALEETILSGKDDALQCLNDVFPPTATDIMMTQCFCERGGCGNHC